MVGLFEISQKERLFHLLWQPSTLGGTLMMQSPFSHLSEKSFLSPSVWQEENIPGNSIKRRAYWVILKIARMFFISWSKNRMINTFNLPSSPKNSFKGKMLFFMPKSPSFSLQFGQEQIILRYSFERRAC